MNFKHEINPEKLPQHVAIIMDGNGRWAKQKGKLRIFGHQNGVTAVRDTAEAAAEIGVKYLTLYAFSTENWNRPKIEVEALMTLLVATINKETTTLLKNDIKLETIGDTESLPEKCRKELAEAIEKTKHCKRMTLVLALSYSSKWEIINGFKNIAEKVKTGKINVDDIDENLIDEYLCTKNYPDPELMIRTSGEHRISNFLLWQLAYAEFYFTEKLWPDFSKDDFYQAILDYQKRERRFGKTSEQISNQ
jgi:undecaprenyl diphosphate synthase